MATAVGATFWVSLAVARSEARERRRRRRRRTAQ
jgi:hypothetical protein